MRRFTNSLLLALVLLPAVAWADLAGSVNIRALGGTTIPSGLVDANGIKIQCVTGCSGSTAFTDNSAFTASTSAIANIGGVFNDALAAVTSGNAAATRITDRRGLHVNLRNVSGTEMGTSGAPLRVDPTGSTPQPVSGTVAISGTVTVSGTVTANQGGSPWGMRLQDGSGATLAAVTAGNALKTDGSAVTQPVSGTFWQATQPVSGTVTVTDGAGALNVIVDSGSLTANAGTNLNTSALALESGGNLATLAGVVDAIGTAVPANAAVVAGTDGTNTRALKTDTGGELQVDVLTLPSVTINTFPDNEPINVAQMNGVAVTMGNGTAGTGVQRVTIASDSTGQVAVASLPNEGQQTAANSISVAIASDQSNVPVSQATASSLNMRPDTSGATGAAPPARANFAGGLTSGATGGLLTGFAVCDSFVNVNVSTATTTLLITGVSGRHVRICAMSLVTLAANNVALISGTGATCATGTTGMNGGTTAGAGWNFAANSGLSQGSGLGEINQTNATGDSVCVVTSAATQLSGRISYATY